MKQSKRLVLLLVALILGLFKASLSLPYSERDQDSRLNIQTATYPVMTPTSSSSPTPTSNTELPGQWKLKRTLFLQNSTASYLRVLPNGYLVSASHDGQILTWDPQSGVLQANFSIDTDSKAIGDMVVFDNGDLVLSCWGWDGGAYPLLLIVDPFTGFIKTKLPIYSFESGGYRLSLFPNGNLALLPSGYDLFREGQTVAILDPVSLKTISTFKHNTSLSAMAAFANGDLATATPGKINVWDTITGTLRKNITAHFKDSVTSLEALPNGYLASFTAREREGVIEVWNVATGDCKHTFFTCNTEDCGPDWPGVLVALPNQSLASVVYDDAGKKTWIRIWDLTTGSRKQTLQEHTGSINDVTVLANGDLASASKDGTIKIWSLN